MILWFLGFGIYVALLVFACWPKPGRVRESIMWEPVCERSPMSIRELVDGDGWSYEALMGTLLEIAALPEVEA